MNDERQKGGEILISLYLTVLLRVARCLAHAGLNDWGRLGTDWRRRTQIIRGTQGAKAHPVFVPLRPEIASK